MDASKVFLGEHKQVAKNALVTKVTAVVLEHSIYATYHVYMPSSFGVDEA
jgi:hypothetical protein